MTDLDALKEHLMTWTIANAKQHFSEVVRLCAKEPQAVFDRSRPVAVVVSARDYSAFASWQREQRSPEAIDVPGLFADAREALKAQGLDGLDLPERANRPDVDWDPDPHDAEPEATAPDHAAQ
jgi:prevent-host-death family protein